MIEDYVQIILNAISSHNVAIPPLNDLVVELYTVDSETNKCGYYFVHHSMRSIYWLEDVALELQCGNIPEIRGELSEYQIRKSAFLISPTSHSHAYLPLRHPTRNVS